MAPRPVLRRRPLLAGLLACGLSPARAETQRFRITLANLDETPGVTLDGLGFTGAELRRSFELAARSLPVDMVYFDNAGDPTRAVANAEAAIAAHVDLLIEYNADADANAEIARRLVVPGGASPFWSIAPYYPRWSRSILNRSKSLCRGTRSSRRCHWRRRAGSPQPLLTSR